MHTSATLLQQEVQPHERVLAGALLLVFYTLVMFYASSTFSVGRVSPAHVGLRSPNPQSTSTKETPSSKSKARNDARSSTDSEVPERGPSTGACLWCFSGFCSLGLGGSADWKRYGWDPPKTSKNRKWLVAPPGRTSRDVPPGLSATLSVAAGALRMHIAIR